MLVRIQLCHTAAYAYIQDGTTIAVHIQSRGFCVVEHPLESVVELGRNVTLAVPPSPSKLTDLLQTVRNRTKRWRRPRIHKSARTNYDWANREAVYS